MPTEDDDLLPPAPAPRVAPPAPSGKIRCGFCESALTGSGEVIKLSDRAKALRDFEDDLADIKRDLEEAQETIARHQSTIREHEQTIAALTAPKKGAIDIR
jgi:hypothetical protein